MRNYEKIFCLDCKVRIETKQMPAIFGGGSNSKPSVEYADGWRCAECADKYKN